MAFDTIETVKVQWLPLLMLVAVLFGCAATGPVSPGTPVYPQALRTSGISGQVVAWAYVKR